ncbi:MAG: CDP-archaeol synthase [Maritimibacter sp.]
MPDSDKGRVQSSKWADLGTRVASAIVLVGIVLGALWTGALAWKLLVLAIVLIMLWELAPLCATGLDTPRRVLLAASPLFAIGLRMVLAVVQLPLSSMIVVLIPALFGLAILPRGRLIWFGYVLMISLGATVLVMLFSSLSAYAVIALVALVAISDTLGYFAGRLIGGPKFWPRVSPKKTWSGTIAGWVGAALFGAFVLAPYFAHHDVQETTPVLFAFLAVLIAFAGQMGDIAESAIKRRAGVKDASNLIPGHGGFLDRLDALIAASAMLALIAVIMNYMGLL